MKIHPSTNKLGQPNNIKKSNSILSMGLLAVFECGLGNIFKPRSTLFKNLSVVSEHQIFTEEPKNENILPIQSNITKNIPRALQLKMELVPATSNIIRINPSRLVTRPSSVRFVSKYLADYHISRFSIMNQSIKSLINDYKMEELVDKVEPTPRDFNYSLQQIILERPQTLINTLNDLIYPQKCYYTHNALYCK